MNKNEKTGGIIAITGVIVGVWLMLKVWAILGMIVYMITFGASLFKLKHSMEYHETFNIFVFLKRISKETFWKEGVFAIIVASIPVIICVFLYSWVILDSIRGADYIASKVYQ